MTDVINFKGTKSGLDLIMNPAYPFNTILESTMIKLNEMTSFFRGSTVNITFMGKTLTDVEKAVLEKRVLDVLSGSCSVTFDDNLITAPDTAADADTTFHKGTIRSGQRVTSRGHLIVIGDVNPGGEVIAAGNIVVLGNLRGIAHAGGSGDSSAVVIALNLSPTQLRISDIFTRPPDGEVRRMIMPEFAYIKDGEIYIEQLSKAT